MDGTDELSVKLLQKAESPFRVRFATDTTVLIEQEGMENLMRIERVTRMPREPGILLLMGNSIPGSCGRALPVHR